MYIFFVMPYGMWDLGFLINDHTHSPALETQSANHWTSREVPLSFLFFSFFNYLLGRARSVSTALRSKGTRSFE